MLVQEINLIVLEWLSRMLLAILFFFQAYDRIFCIGLKEATNIIYYQNSEQKFPLPIVQIGVYVTAYLELISSVLFLNNPKNNNTEEISSK
jgi:hypothetical protein